MSLSKMVNENDEVDSPSYISSLTRVGAIRRILRCDDCEAIYYTNIEDFKEHAKIHQKERNFFCRICFSSLIHAANVIQHTKIHFDPKFDCLSYFI